MNQLLTTIASIPDCVVLPEADLPKVASDYELPQDLVEFYSLCGGVELFGSSAYSMEIVASGRLVRANPVIFSGMDEQQIQQTSNDISWSWHIIGEGENRQYVTIDLAPERLGRCYDSFWDTHAMPGSSPIIALTFTELLSRLLDSQGNHWYWLQPDFSFIGDAYG
jgi:antitoxin YokJ